MIKRLYVDNYKCLVNFELELDKLSLLLGPNGVGKSSVLDVIFALRHLLGGMAKVTDKDVFPTSTLTRWQDRKTQVFELGVSLENDPDMTYRLEVEHDRSTRRARIVSESLIAEGKPLFKFISGKIHLYRDDYTEGPVYSADWSESAMCRAGDRHDNKRLNHFLDFIRKILVCGLYPKKITTESMTEDSLLDRDGQNFSAWCRHIFQERPDLVQKYSEELRHVIAGFSDMRLESVGLETRAFMVTFKDKDKVYKLRLDELSDGQRALIVLYALVFVTAGQGYTLFLDEPDNYIALPEIQPWLIELSDICGDKLPQAVICSHHPELIDYLGVERGILLHRETSGVVNARRPQYQNIDGLKLSELVARGWE